MTTCRITPAAVGDLPALEALERTVFPGEAYPRFFLRQAVALWPDWMLVARSADHDAPLGYILGAAAAAPGEAWILSMATGPAARGRGVGGGLLAALIARLTTAGVRTVALTVHPDNAAALRLYRRAGFTVATTTADYFGPGHPRHTLRLALPSTW